jgi:hypothetical protein
MFVWFFFCPLNSCSCFLVSTKMERIPPIIIPLRKVLSGLHSPYPNVFGAHSYFLLHKSQQMYKLVSEIHSTTVQTPPKQAPAARNCISLFAFFLAFTYTKQTPFPLPRPQPCQNNPRLSSVFF